MPEVAIRPRAQLDIESIYLHIAVTLKSPAAADGIIEALYQAMGQIAEFPESGTRFEEEGLERTYRRVLKDNYWIYYTFDDSQITVWRVFHARQDIDDYALIEL